ncbi:universal stress protein [Actinomadura sp. HBU206391]|uniref:universal stress protein n=1 Tax=Actinomadura sp. HBU206391 TaxID=2731692 RepID=UPI0016508D9C|nr:universal stress protein [Actinomadura sp. HBU206391]MBC6463025.1 universal stress protein [Actinomadura sp. HBU206391]
MSWHSHVVVGYDGSRDGDRVVRWAVTEAKLRRIGVTICHAWHWEYPMTQIDPEWLGIVKRMAGHVLDHGVFIARTIAPTVQVRKVLLPGPASSVLLHEAEDAEAIVVGSGGEGDVPAGSTAMRLAAMASCPVVVIRSAGPADGRIVVGVDESAGSDAALAFAFEEAALKGWQVHAVHGCGDPPLDTDPEIIRRRAGVLLERAVAPWRDKYPQVAAWTRLVMEPAHEALVKAATGTEMLVVGDQGAGVHPPLTLGPVSRAMLHRAPCTVTVAHHWRSSGDVDESARARPGARADRPRPTPLEPVRSSPDIGEGDADMRRWPP